MTREEAIKWYADEIQRLKLAPIVNGCEMKQAWAEQIEIHSMAIEALRGQLFNCEHSDNGFCRKYSTLEVAYPCKGDGDCEVDT